MVLYFVQQQKFPWSKYFYFLLEKYFFGADTFYFYLSNFFEKYFYFYLSNFFTCYLYFYSSTEVQYFFPTLYIYACVNCMCDQTIWELNLLHRFPHSKPDLLMQWTANMHRKDFKPMKKSVVCSDHFEEKWFNRTGQTVRLRDGAVPTIFKLPEHLVKVHVTRTNWGLDTCCGVRWPQ